MWDNVHTFKGNPSINKQFNSLSLWTYEPTEQPYKKLQLRWNNWTLQKNLKCENAMMYAPPKTRCSDIHSGIIIKYSWVVMHNFTREGI